MRVFVLFLATVVATVPTLQAQGPVIDITTATAPVDVLTIQDVDFVNSLTPKWLFTIDLKIRNAPAGTPSSVNATMKLTLGAVLATGESFADVSRYETFPFAIPGTRSFTNIDLISTSIRKSYVTSEEAKRRLEQVGLPTGYLPAGVYTFRVEVTTERYNQTFTATFRFVLSNPSRVELVFPFANDQSVGEFPLFQWQFDGPRSRIAVFEMESSMSSPEEATNRVPHLRTEVEGTSFLYPAAGVRPLEVGKSYVWYVEGLFGLTGGTAGTVQSQIRRFTVAAGGTNAAMQSLLEELEKALGPGYKPLFDRIRAGGLSPTGQLWVDGKMITTTDLVKLINHFRANPAGVLSADIE